MTPEEWQRAKQIFQDALELPSEQRAGFVEKACGTDLHIREEIESLLRFHELADDFIEEPLVAATADALLHGTTQNPAGQSIGKYRIIEQIGAGGMGVVYLAERDDVGSQVAIKILPNALFSPSRRQRFSSEQRTLARLKHEYIAQLYDADVLSDGTPWFAMEYVPGVHITDYCKTVSIDERLDLFRMVCEAVRYAHSRMVVHRDLKPSNILVTSDRYSPTPKLLDFGIARHIDGDASGEHTVAGIRPMTIGYAAPELFEGPGWFQADVYSLGVVLYELLTGQLPFDLKNKNYLEAQRIITETRPEKPSTIAMRKSGGSELTRPRAGSWTDLDMLCLKAMHSDPNRRYESAESLLKDLDRYFNSKPLTARPDTVGYRVGKFVKRHQWGVATAVTIFAMIVTLVSVFTFRLARARNQALAAAAQTKRAQSFMGYLLSGGGDPAGPSSTLKVVTLLDRGEQLARTLNNEPELQSEFVHSLGSSYRNLGLLDKADPLLSSAFELRKQRLGEEHPQVVESMIELGLLRLAQVRLPEAEQLLRSAVTISDRTGADKGARVRATIALGRVANAQQKYPEAMQLLQTAIDLQSVQGPASPELAEAVGQLAQIHFYAGRYEVANELYNRALTLNRQIFGDSHINVAHELMNLGSVQVQWANATEAQKLFEQALEITQRWYNGPHPEVASNLTLIGGTLFRQRRFEEAEQRFAEAIKMAEETLPKNHPRIAFPLNESGVLYSAQGKWDEAEKRYRRVIEINTAAYGEEHFRTLVAMSNLASVYMKRDDYAHAESILQTVVERFAKRLPDHMNAAVARVKLGRALVEQKKFKEAETHLLVAYQILMKQGTPPEDWLQNARGDLIKVYEALGEPAKAEPFRREQQAKGR